MAAIRIIPCLDVKDGRVVKGVHFKNLLDAGDPAEHADFYSRERADELVCLDISATPEGRNTMVDVVRKVSDVIFIPMTVGGGIKSLQHIETFLKAGADKISMNTFAVRNPEVIREGAKKFGSQCIVIAIDGKNIGKDRWEVYVEGGKTPTGIDVVEWARKVEDLGAGEILLTSIDMDGTQSGYDVRMTRTVADSVRLPVIASGGAGALEHLSDVVKKGRASAVLLASLLHFRKFTIAQIKDYFRQQSIEVRL